MRMRRCLGFALATLALSSAPLAATELKPLSLADKQRLETLLRKFDPATYDIRFQYVDAKGKVQNARLGTAVGLGSVRQGPTTHGNPQMYTIDLSPPISIRLGANQTVNGFNETIIVKTDTYASPAKTEELKASIRELNQLLRGYTR